jgi:hypothetical protein
MAVKIALGLERYDEVHQYLARYNLLPMPEGLFMEGPGQSPRPAKFQHEMLAVYKRVNNNVSPDTDAATDQSHTSVIRGEDIAILSAAHALNMGTPMNLVKEFIANIELVSTIESFMEVVAHIMKMPSVDQSKNDKISVGCVIGVIDLIGEDEIIDIKCAKNEDINKWFKQIYVYACLWYLRYGKIMKYAVIWNFLTGTKFEFPLKNIESDAKAVIRALSDLPEHVAHLQ